MFRADRIPTCFKRIGYQHVLSGTEDHIKTDLVISRCICDGLCANDSVHMFLYVIWLVPLTELRLHQQLQPQKLGPP